MLENSISKNEASVIKIISHFSEYSDNINLSINNASDLDQLDIYENILQQGILNGRTTEVLNKLIPVSIRKQAGIFFTSNKLANKVSEYISPLLKAGTKIIDPACGAGNLLVACAKKLPIGNNLSETVETWSDLVTGYDLFPEFVRAARLRILLLATSFHQNEIRKLSTIDPNKVIKGITAGDIFAQGYIQKDACIVVNPPFGHISSSPDCTWAKGKIQTAAQFIEKLIQLGNKGQHIVAILPDVLRSGTRYNRWREHISSYCESICVELAGRFDKNTDVDVFIFHAVIGEKGSYGTEWPPLLSKSKTSQNSVFDFFDVHVGAVVPHRDPLNGLKYPYIHARTASGYKIIQRIYERRKFLGKVFLPPFVVLHRTSNPNDRRRIVAALINTNEHVAVENHLIVLLPKDKSYKSCQLLLKLLKLKQSTEWFNKRIRCRHLTVSSVRELPWMGKTP